jgi:hypothetical protein
MKRVTDQCDRFGKLTDASGFYKKATPNRKTLEYMKNRQFVVSASSAKIVDYVIGEEDKNFCCVNYSDGEYEWTSNDILYASKYHMKLDENFVAKTIE